MSRAGPRCLLPLLLLLLSAAAGAPAQPPQPGGSAGACLATGACFSAHRANGSYAEARSACARRRGALAWLDGEPELRLVAALLAAVPGARGASLFWLGLTRNASACTDAAAPLRGFSWEAGGAAAPRHVPAALGRWAKEPARSCLTARCAGLLLAPGAAWGWKERPCQRQSHGYVCKYQYEGACAALRPAGALGLDYRLPFGERSAEPGPSPPGTVLAVACPGPRGVVRLTCEAERDGAFVWRGAHEPVCPCPFGYVRPESSRCADAAECRDSDGAFACVCAPGGRDGGPCAAPAASRAAPSAPAASPAAPSTPAASRAAPSAPAASPAAPSTPAAAGGRLFTPTPGGSAGPPDTAAAAEQKTAPPSPASPSSSSSNYVFILVTVAVVVLVILVMTVLGVFRICFNHKAAGRGHKEPRAGEAEAAAAEQRGAAGGD